MIYKRNGRWHLDVTIDGVRYREALNTTDRREASALEKKRVGEIQQGRGVSKTGKEFARKPFSEAAKSFLEDRAGHVADRTIQFERERLKPLAAYFSEKPLRQIKAEDVAAYQQARLRAGLSGKTINMDVGVLRLMMKRAKCWSMVADDVKLFPKRSRQIGRVLTSEQKMHLFKIAGSRPEWLVAYCAAVLAVSTTCRSIELKHIRWRDVDLFNRTVSVKRSKTAAGHRTIPLNGDAATALARLLERAQANGANESEHFVFPACENERIDPTRPQKTWRSAWRKLVRAAARTAGRNAAKLAFERGAGIAAALREWRAAAAPFLGFRFHDLRHQAITEMAENGATDATLKAVAGHIDQAMMEHYSHVRMAAKREALSKLESGLMAQSDSAPSADADLIN